MGRTQLTTREIGSVQRNDADVTTSGQALITKVIAGTNVSLSSTGVDAGTGDVTINSTLPAAYVTLAMMANVASGGVFYRKTAGAGPPEVQTLATLKTDLGLTGTNSGDQTITLTGAVTGSGTGSFATTLSNSTVGIANLTATGTPSSSVFLRGDNTWATPSASVAWGGITGTLSSQSDLNTALGLKANLAGANFTAAVWVTATTQQFALRYDASNYFTTTIASDGRTVFNNAGTGAFYQYYIGGVQKFQVSTTDVKYCYDDYNYAIMTPGSTGIFSMSAVGSGGGEFAFSSIARFNAGVNALSVGASNYNYTMGRNASTGIFEIYGNQSGYRGYLFNYAGVFQISHDSNHRVQVITTSNNTYAGIELAGRDTGYYSWYIDSRGGADTPNNRFAIANNAGTEMFSIKTDGTVTVSSLTGKINQVVESITSGSSLTPNGSTTNLYDVTALAVNATINLPSGSVQDGQKMIIRIKDNGSARTLTWNGSYRVIGTTLPTTTVAGKIVYIGIVYNAASSTWDVVSVAQQT